MTQPYRQPPRFTQPSDLRRFSAPPGGPVLPYAAGRPIGRESSRSGRPRWDAGSAVSAGRLGRPLSRCRGRSARGAVRGAGRLRPRRWAVTSPAEEEAMTDPSAPVDLTGEWCQLDDQPECAAAYPRSLTFGTGTYRGTRGEGQGFVRWDAGTYRVVAGGLQL